MTREFGSTISEEENEVLSRLKRDGVLIRIILNQVRKAKNGGVLVVCSDGDIDVSDYYRLISHRPHEVKVFGGPLLLAPSFPAFRESDASFLIDNIIEGMEIKRTKTARLCFHTLCAKALAYGCASIKETLEFANDAKRYLSFKPFFAGTKMDIYFQVKRKNKGGDIEENLYHLAA